jgi:glycogen synthase
MAGFCEDSPFVVVQVWNALTGVGLPGGFAGQNLQMAIMGTGSAWMATALQSMANVFKGRGVGLPLFDEQIAHLLLSAADYVLVPSRFEPCGLVAQSGCRYGAVPIVTSVGGLKDLVTEDVCPFPHDYY